MPGFIFILLLKFCFLLEFLLIASTWSQYESGVFDGCNQVNPDLNHAVQLVGTGTDPELGDYWALRNSWAPLWGESGLWFRAFLFESTRQFVNSITFFFQLFCFSSNRIH